MEQLDEIIQLTKKLIVIPSVSGDSKKSRKILALAKGLLSGHAYSSFTSNNFPSLLYSNRRTETKKYKIILNAHLDVVPGTKKNYFPVEKNGKLYGRGAFDMKAAAAVMILLFKELADKLSYPLGLQLTTDEEISGHHGTRHQISQGIRTDFAIMGECNSNFQITNQSKGRFVIKITCKGDSAHGAHPWRGKNAIWEMYKALIPLMKAFPIPNKETYETTVSITKITTESDATNQIPDLCIAYLDVRFHPKDTKTILATIRSILPSTLNFATERIREAHYTDPTNRYIQHLRKITTTIRGKELPFRFAHATSDAPFFSKVGCPAVEFGPVGYGPHAENEWVDIKSLGDYYQILKNFLLHFDTTNNKM